MAAAALLALLAVSAGAFRQQAPSGGVPPLDCDQDFAPPKPRGTNCPDAKWVDEMLRVDPSPGKVFVDIGCNKGNDAMAWLEMWDASPMGVWDTHKWIDYYDKELGIQHYACTATVPSVKASQLQPNPKPLPNTLVCVEPMRNNVRALRKARSALGYGNGTTEFGTFAIVQAAVSGKAQRGETVDFPDLDAGVETAGLKSAVRVPVPLKTVDQIKSELGLPRVDVLTIDTEGADPAVLEGAAEALATARYLEFEVHRDFHTTVWGNTSLKSVVGKLDLQGFDCFWAGNNGKLLSLNSCWRDSFEHGTWANAACVRRGDPWWAVMRKFAGGVGQSHQ